MEKINWINNSQPALNATNLNRLQDNVEGSLNELSQNKFDKASVKGTYSVSDENTYSCNYINGMIESGSNSDGEYTKLSDGTLICRKIVRGSVNITTSWNGLYEGSLNLGNTPYTFANNSYQMSLTPQDGSGVLVEQAGKERTTNSFGTATLARPNSTTANPVLDLIAIGRWK